MVANSVALSIQIGLRIVGIWPNAPYALLFRCGWIFTIGIIQTCQYWWIVIHFGTRDLSHLLDGLSVTMEYTVMLLKLIILWLNSRIFYDALAAMVSDWKEATVNDVHTMTSKANLSRRFSNVIIGLHSVGAFSYGIGVLVSNTDDYEADAIETPVREFTLKMQLPFECNESPLYELVMCLEFLHQLASSAMTGILNSLIITLVSESAKKKFSPRLLHPFYGGITAFLFCMTTVFILHASGQIDILCDALREISLEKNNRQLAVSITKELIGKHQKIIVFSNKIEKIFCYIALIQFMSSTLVTCCLGYMIVTSISTIQVSDTIDGSALMKAIVFYMAAMVEAFIFCFCGEYLSAKSKMISDAAYKSIWYDLKPNDSKLILLIMLRSQRRLTITAGKIMDLSLEGFTNIMKASISYVSVLHAMY